MAAGRRILQNSLFFSLLAGNLGWRPVRSGLYPPPRSSMRTDVFRSLTNSAKFAGVFAGSMRGIPSLPVVEEATGPSLWDGVRSAFDLQT